MRTPLLYILAVLLSAPVCAAEPAKPQPPKEFVCTNVKPHPQENNIILESARSQNSQVYFIKNTSSKSIWIDHPVKNPSASAGWSSYLRPGNWSVFMVDKKDFVLSCSVIHPGKVEILNCSQALALCTPKNAIVNSNRKGSYWIVEDNSYDEAVKVFQKRMGKQPLTRVNTK